MKKHLGFTANVVIICFLMALVGCRWNNNPGNVEAPESTQKAEAQTSAPTAEITPSDWKLQQKAKWHIGKEAEVSWYIGFNWHTWTKDWNEYTLLKDAKEITGVSPKVTVPTGDEAEKINLMIATGDLPDMITLGLNDPAVDKLIKGGFVYTYDELIETYIPELKNEIPQDVWDATKSEIDNKLYGLPGGYLPEWLLKSKDDVGAYTYNARKDFYAELGSPDISTPDALYDALKKFKETYPEINGKPSIPLSLGETTDPSQFLLMIQHSFGMREQYIDGSGNVSVNAKNPQYKEMMKFLNKLYREKLIDSETFIKGSTQIQEDLKSRVFIMPIYFWYMDGANAALDHAKPESHFHSIEPLKAVDDVKFPGLGRLGGQITLITKKAKDPEAAIKLVRYMFSRDGQLLLHYGHEGEDYTITDGIITRTDAVKDAWIKDITTLSETTGIWTFVYHFLKPFPEVGKEAPDRMAFDRPIANNYSYDNTMISYKMNPDATTPEGIISTKIKEIMVKDLPKIIMADSEAESLKNVDEMVARMEKMGLSILEKFWTDRYNKNVEKFKREMY